MSYRELRNFCEIMRGLGYPRLISIENFRKPNFELVADILYWLAQRFDPQENIIDSIEEERHRVEFIKQVATLFKQKTRIKLNTKKLYGSDGLAVQEILKVASVLYKAYNSTPSDEAISQGFQLPANLSNLKGHKQVATEITEIGARLYDSLGKEKDLKQHREKALTFLDSISRNLESNSEQQYVEKCVKEIIQQQDQNIDEMERYVTNLERDQRTLEEKIRKRTLELEKSQKRLKLMTGMRPTYLDEYERLEVELEKMYEVYVERFRNLNYLENQLHQYNKIEQKQFEKTQAEIRELGEQITAEEIRVLEGKDDIDHSKHQIDDLDRGQSRGDSRAIGSRNNKRNLMGNVGEEPGESDQSSIERGDEDGSGQEDLEDSGDENADSGSDDF